jgi:hypothetical protein
MLMLSRLSTTAACTIIRKSHLSIRIKPIKLPLSWVYRASSSISHNRSPRALCSREAPRHVCTAERRSDTGSSSTETDKTESNGNFDGQRNESEGTAGNRAHGTDVDPALEKLKEGTEPSTAEAGAEQQQEGTTQTYRKIIGLWVSSRESDLRSLASESSVAVRDFLSDPSVSVFGR